MTERLVPYKSAKYRNAEATGMLVVLLLTTAAGRVVEQSLLPPHPVYGLPFIAMLLTTLVYPFAGILWARTQNLEQVPYSETVRRYFDETYAVSIFDTAWRLALFVGSMILFVGLAMSQIEDWPMLAPVVALTLLLGFVAGTYSALYARHWHSSAQDFTSVPQVSSWERMGRHYFGYAIGLAAALATASQVGTGFPTAVLILIAFVAAKFVADLLLPQPPFNYAAPLELRWHSPFIVIAFGVLQWGVPLAILSSLITHAVSPNLSIEEGVLQSVITSLIVGGVWGLSFWVIALFARWGRKPKAT